MSWDKDMAKKDDEDKIYEWVCGCGSLIFKVQIEKGAVCFECVMCKGVYDPPQVKAGQVVPPSKLSKVLPKIVLPLDKHSIIIQKGSKWYFRNV